MYTMILPRHVAVVMDGNRRWARGMGFANPSVGHRYGAEHVDDLLRWCAELGIDHVTVFVCSRDNLLKRDSDEVAHLMRMVEEVIVGRRSPQWRLHAAGRLDILPASTREALRQAALDNEPTGRHLTVAIGYDGRDEIIDAVRSLLKSEAGQGVSAADLASRLSPEDISGHLYSAPRPDPDLVIRTSGERRLSGFLTWQSAHSELFFTDAYWPGFTKAHFLKALNAFAKKRQAV
jgi:short-chain Z-isoprenyl diphosphate synthase